MKKILLFFSLIIFGVSLYVIKDYLFPPQEIVTPPTPLPQSLKLSDQPKINPPALSSDVEAASISAQSFVVFDVLSGQIVATKHPDQRLMPASTTKMMTALIAIDEYDPEEVITLSRATDAIGHKVDFSPGEQLTTINMIKAMMINSGNDAAIALADHHPSGYWSFVDLMNQKAASFGLKNTHFSNVSGVEADDHYSTAADLSIIANQLMGNQTLRSIVGTKTTTINTVDGKVSHPLENLNQLLWETPGVIGIKTGWTEIAGDCLVTYISRDHDLITVILDSTDRFQDSKILIEWAYRNLIW